MHAVGKEIACVGDQNNQRALNPWEPAHIGILQRKSGPNPYDNANDQAGEEDEQENPNSLKQADDVQISRRSSFPVSLGGLKQDDGDGVVENGLAEDDGVEFRLDFVEIEDGEDGDWVCGRERGTDRDGFDPGDLQAVEGYPGP
jgi:hypothetical protein